MRLKQLTLLVSITTLVLSGCSAGRSISGSQQIAANQDGPVMSGYDHDPPAMARPRLAIQPAPVPPASGTPQIRGISFLKILGHDHGHCADEPCLAKANVGCGVCDDTCGQETCGDDCGEKCKVGCRPSWPSRCLSSLKNKCSRKSSCAEECTSEAACSAPAETCCQTDDDACAESECGETSCCKPWYRKLHMPKFSHSCKSDKCVEECCESEEKCCTDADDCCADEGCNGQKKHCRLLTCLLNSAMHNPLCRLKPRLGSFCHASCNKGCGDEGCTDADSCGNECGKSKHARSTSPLADCLAEDPFAHQHKDESEQGQNKPVEVPDAPMTPPAGHDGPSEKYEQSRKVPANSEQPTEQLSPPAKVPPTPSGQAYKEPEFWPRLKAGEDYNTQATPVRTATPAPHAIPVRVATPVGSAPMQHVWHY